MNRTATLAALAFAATLPAVPAAAQSIPGLPHSVGQEIDRAMQQLPLSQRPATRGTQSVGQEIDQLISRSGSARPSRQVRLGFENKAQYKALVIQFAPTGATDWGVNRLQRETLNPRARMTWPIGGQECRYDVRITFALGGEFVRLGHDFCAQEKIEVTQDAVETAPLPVREGVALYRVVNNSNERVAVLRVTPAGASRAQPDLLGIWMMEHGDIYTGRVARGGNCLFDIRAGFDPEDTQTVTVSRQNLCETPEIAIPPRPARTAAGG